MEKEMIEKQEIEKNTSIKKYFREVYNDEFEDPCEEFTDVLYDLIPENIIGNELKKIRGIKVKHGKFYSVEKVKR